MGRLSGLITQYWTREKCQHGGELMKEGAISPYIVLAPAEDDADGEETQMSIANTGWSEEEMERMRAMGYDGMDIIRAWYS